MKKIRKKILLAVLFVLTFLVFINNGWGFGHGWGWGWGWGPVPPPVYPYPYPYPYPGYYPYGPSPYHPCYTLTLSVINVLPVVAGKSYVMDVIYNGRLLYKAVPQGERRLLRMRSCAYSTDQRVVTIDVKDISGNFIGTTTRVLYIDASRNMVWNIAFNDIQQGQQQYQGQAQQPQSQGQGQQQQQNNPEILEQ